MKANCLLFKVMYHEGVILRNRSEILQINSCMVIHWTGRLDMSLTEMFSKTVQNTKNIVLDKMNLCH